MRGWPHSVLMPGQPRKKDAKTKGIADLTLGDRRRLHAALIDKEISVGKANSKTEHSTWSDTY